MSKSVIRIAKPEDAEELLKIYAPYVKHTAITFEYEVPTVEEFRDRIEHILKRHPYLVAERDGELIGYAYAGVFNEREACDRSVETAIYVRMGEEMELEECCMWRWRKFYRNRIY